jgi:hypothetical protein
LQGLSHPKIFGNNGENSLATLFVYRDVIKRRNQLPAVNNPPAGEFTRKDPSKTKSEGEFG